MTMVHTFWPANHVTHQSIDPWPATHDYSRVMTPDYCSFQSGPLSGRALKIKHHHCHKILRRNNWIKLTLWLNLCRKSLQCLKNEIMGQRVTSTDPWPRWPTQICWPIWPVTRWPVVISARRRLIVMTARCPCTRGRKGSLFSIDVSEIVHDMVVDRGYCI